jgi:hypothetical protein
MLPRPAHFCQWSPTHSYTENIPLINISQDLISDLKDHHEIIMLPHHTAAASEEQTGEKVQIQMEQHSLSSIQ